ncbi:MAG: multicopper oxidase domain-containing protein, partial [Gemmatimonadetes bacterium]|nr:multicopper oxidase domain-containing protein [Gemmatimonadota bacterium]NIQ58116.1 multicopper oxidase domain-containing protein [Gemmatimonadota bacterium]NIU78317.1 multicopper oxidase domain-containing protein [Gammaproteobacteria bacterium]NIX47270.1 multicopper oxidase domain-containing protein [Gemmatimonadota bacterium]NIY11647.1 multicopper oxidase domain-containing protein [Gemmatimonadota bacterium]
RSGRAITMNGTVPGPLLRFREGDEAVIHVTNRLEEDTSIHWHGLILPNPMDGVPQVNFPGIRPGET